MGNSAIAGPRNIYMINQKYCVHSAHRLGTHAVPPTHTHAYKSTSLVCYNLQTLLNKIERIANFIPNSSHLYNKYIIIMSCLSANVRKQNWNIAVLINIILYYS